MRGRRGNGGFLGEDKELFAGGWLIGAKDYDSSALFSMVDLPRRCSRGGEISPLSM